MPAQVFLASLIIVFLTELGDKTMIATILLSAEHRQPSLVLIASLAALATSTFIAIIIGVVLSSALPLDLIIYLSGVIFIVLGLYTLFKKEESEETTENTQITFLSMFSLVLVSELGDKSQLAILAIAAQSLFPAFVFIGAVTGFLLLNSIGAFSGDKIGENLPMNAIRAFTGIVFIIIGTLVLFRMM
ncbi:MAG: hypothetical protein GF411_05755 [Candidatus Lokiarchaeota archaeon]|nr:hypothetical protein [Candidatus Lokiarchaeota archaeon]